MATKKGGLGKGISQLFVENAPEDALTDGAVTLPIGDIDPDRNQPRTNFDDTALQELADSVAAHGILQPILVRPQSDGSYRIVAGERRYRAARMAGLTEVPVVIKVLSDAEAAAIALIENLQREDLNPMEEAIGIKRLMDEFGLTQNEAAERLSKSRPAVANALRLLQLPEDCIELVADGTLSAGHARTLLGLENKEMIYEVALTVSEKGLSVRDTEKLVKKLNKPAKETETPPIAHYHSEVALSLSTVLGRKVNIVTAKGAGKTGGKIEFEFFDDDDLQKIAKLFDN
ncbi:MAG: ParB/RepB/Spo0J family partition protein [Ruminococcaceae bacterium]|nr:ParB/RepB/Spo0J family partition protein [Oscillospiraceae bacterium]